MMRLEPSPYSRYYTEACNKLQDRSPRLSAWATQKRRSGDDLLATLYPIRPARESNLLHRDRCLQTLRHAAGDGRHAFTHCIYVAIGT